MSASACVIWGVVCGADTSPRKVQSGLYQEWSPVRQPQLDKEDRINLVGSFKVHQAKSVAVL